MAGRIVPLPRSSPVARQARGSYRVAEAEDMQNTPALGSGDYHADPRTREKILRLAGSADRNAVLFSGPITRYIGYLLGDGTWPRPRLPAGKEEVVKRWQADAQTTRFDASERFTLPQLLKLWMRSILRDGDVVGVHDGHARVQVCESERLVAPSTGRTTDIVTGGISRDRLGKRLRFWIADYDRNGRISPTYAKPYDADQVTYTALIDRVSQQRGICVFGSGLDDLERLDRLNDAEIRTACAGSRNLAFLEVEKGSAGPAQSGAIVTDAAAVIELAAGRKVVPGNLSRPNLNVPAFTRLNLRLIFLALETPLELLIGELNDLNYSAARSLRNLSEDAFGMARRIHLHQLLNRLWSEWCADNGYGELAVEWEWPRLQIHDRNKEIEADAAELANETTSRKRLVGGDWKTILAELSDEDRERDRLLIERIVAVQTRCNELNGKVKGLALHWSHLLASSGARTAPGAFLQGATPEPAPTEGKA